MGEMPPRLAENRDAILRPLSHGWIISCPVVRFTSGISEFQVGCQGYLPGIGARWEGRGQEVSLFAASMGHLPTLSSTAYPRRLF